MKPSNTTAIARHNPESSSPRLYEVRIEPTRNWLRMNWAEMWDYRDMLRFLVIRDFISRFKQTLLGPLWFIIQPIFNTLIFTVIFGSVAGLSTDGLPQPLFYMCGQLGWLYFATCFTAISTNLLNNANLYKKVYFPRVIVPAATVVSNLLVFMIQFATFLAMWLYFKHFTEAGNTFHMTWAVFLLPFLILQTAALSLGTGLWMNSLTAKYRDLRHMAAFLIQAWMFVTPVIYPMSEVPEKWRWAVNLNPMASIVESYRGALLGRSTVELSSVAQSAGITALILIGGMILFNRIQRDFVDYS